MEQQQDISRSLVLDNIGITGMGLTSVCGDQPIALFGAVGTRMGFSQPHPVFEAPALNGEGSEQVMTCTMDGYLQQTPGQHMLACLLPALDNALNDAQLNQADNHAVLLYIVVPADTTERGQDIDLAHWHTILSDHLAALGDIEIRIKPNTSCVTEHLTFAAQGLVERHWDKVIFGAVDSLIDAVTCMELGEQQRIQTIKSSDGVVPGEAAGFIVLEQIKKVRGLDEVPYAWLKGLATEEEPHVHLADQKRLSGISRAINHVLNQVGVSKEKVSSLILALGTEHNGALEWHQAETTLWPYEANEQERMALQLGEVDEIDPPMPSIPEKLDINLSLGDIGAAGLVLGIILAVARFEFEFPKAKRNLVVEGGDSLFRGVVYVKYARVDKTQLQAVGDAA